MCFLLPYLLLMRFEEVIGNRFTFKVEWQKSEDDEPTRGGILGNRKVLKQFPITYFGCFHEYKHMYSASLKEIIISFLMEVEF